MENRVVEIGDLEIGDEIIVSSLSQLRYLKVISPPKRRTKPNPWNMILGYKPIKCSGRKENVTHSYDYKDGQGVIKTRSWQKKEYICTPDGHNEIKFHNLTGRTIWLIKKGEQWNSN